VSIYRGSPPEVLVDRAAEVETLVAAADDARAGRARVVVVSGPAGIGKTALATRVVGQQTAFRRVNIVADEVDCLVEYSALGQLTAHFRGHPARSAFPLLANGPAPGTTYLAVAAELVRLIGDLEPGTPVALLIEDAQWLDVGSARALQLAARRLGVEPALIIVTTRGGTRPADVGWMRLAATDGLGSHLPLGPLTPAGVDRLALAVRGRSLGPPASRRLREHTGGHPLHTRLLLDHLDWSSLAGATGTYPVPPSIADMVRLRMDTLNTPARDLVAAAAVLGAAAPLPEVASVAGVRDAAAALEEALATGLVTEAAGPGGRALTVPHPLLADAVVETLGPVRRAAAHRAALAHTSGDAALRHAVAAADEPDEDLAARLEAAADQHEAGGRVEAAAENYLAAAGVSPDGDEAQRRFIRGVVLVLTAGDFVRAIGLAPRVRDCGPTTERDTLLALLAFVTGQFATAQDGVHAIAETRDAPGSTRTAAMVDLALAAAKVAMGRGGDAEAAAVVANPAASPSWRRHARLLGALAHGIAGRIEDGLALLRDLPRTPARVGRDDLGLLAARGGLRGWAGREDEALADLRSVRERVDRGEPVRLFLGFALGLLAEAELAVGNWDEALSEAELALAVAEAEGRPAALPPAHAVAAQVHAERGAVESAREHATRCREWADVMPSAMNLVVAALSEAVVARAAGRGDQMLAALAPLAEDNPPFRRSYWRVLHAQALLETGNVAEARRRAAALSAAAGRAGVEARLLAAEAALADFDVAGARQTAASLAAEESRGGPFLAARADLTLGAVTLADGRVPAAVDAVRRAQSRFHDLGAWPWVARCQRTLAGAGETAATAGRVTGSLTRREREVARLAASGLSNAEAAARLYVSRKAVEFHLTNVYNKLGITSRRELAGRLESLRVMPPPDSGGPKSGVGP